MKFLSELTKEARVDVVRQLESTEELAKLAEDDDPYIRRAVAENTNTTAETLAKLAEDHNQYVRLVVEKEKYC